MSVKDLPKETMLCDELSPLTFLILSILKYTSALVELAGKIFVADAVQLDLFAPPQGVFDHLEGGWHIALINNPSTSIPVVLGVHEAVIVALVVELAVLLELALEQRLELLNSIREYVERAVLGSQFALHLAIVYVHLGSSRVALKFSLDLAGNLALFVALAGS